MAENNKIKIEMTEKEADLFLVFKKYQKIWQYVFGQNIRNNKVILHFDGDSQLRKAEISMIIKDS